MAEAVGFEPTRRLSTDLSVFKTDLFNLLSMLPYNKKLNNITQTPDSPTGTYLDLPPHYGNVIGLLKLAGIYFIDRSFNTIILFNFWSIRLDLNQ